MKRFLFALVILTAALASGNPVEAAGIESQTTLGSLQDVVVAIFKVLMAFIPGVATVFLAISGYRYMTSQGNPDMVEKAKKSLTYSVVGVILAYSSVLIILLFARQLGINPGFSL